MRVKYRPEIDGLRAIAVISVIFYHLQIQIFDQELFKGGFIGVDIFFVISGYLITSIIFKELNYANKVSLKYFYERRIRRILPALLAVMLISFPFAWVVLLPIDFVDYSKSIIYSLGFSSNFYFHFSGQEYGAQSGLLKPFLHTWSLSVEEQFYILFPVFIFFIFKFFKKRINIILISIFLLSFTLSNLKSIDSSLNFYFLLTRVWELVAGSLLATYEKDNRFKTIRDHNYSMLVSLGFILIVLSIFFFKLHFRHPSFFTLPSIVGVCLIIFFSNKKYLITKFLSNKFLVSLGLISYSLYLWHYPIFALARVKGLFEKGSLIVFFLVLVTLILSILTYLYVEKPARNKKLRFKNLFFLLSIFVGILLFLNIKNINNHGYEKRFYYSKTYKLSNFDHLDENRKFEKDYNYNDFTLKKNVLIVGNSHAEEILEILNSTSLNNQIYFNLPSPKKRENDYNYQIRYFEKFLTENKSIIDKYKNSFISHLTKQYQKADLIIFASKYVDADLSALSKIIPIIKNDKKEIIIFGSMLQQTTKLRLNRLDYFVYQNKKFPNSVELKNIEYQMFKDLQNTKDINLKLRSFSKKEKIFYFDPQEILCSFQNKKCSALTDNGFKIYWDYSHLTVEGAKYIAKKLEKKKNLMQKIIFEKF
jgi:peptidoglycan/LPS O-acetylase OafA/YrhL